MSATFGQTHRPNSVKTRVWQSLGSQRAEIGAVPQELFTMGQIDDYVKRRNPLKKLAPQAGLEPATLRLTAGCSAIELLRNVRMQRSDACGPARPIAARRTHHGSQT